ncbi:calmodulin-binding protein [Rhodopirellula bahusiensis]|uniref:calmodulin-binding protein n=1 Tax=Rhodopirellula bahusiensis TaxID=2014065 RepID=UPI003267504B
MTTPAAIEDRQCDNPYYGEYLELKEDCDFDNHMESLVQESSSEHKKILWNRYYEQLKRQMQSETESVGSLRALAQKGYGLEKLDGQHRTSDLLLRCLVAYRSVQPPQPFFEWLSSLGEFGVIAQIRRAGMLHIQGRASRDDGNIYPSEVKQLLNRVAYLDSKARGRYRVDRSNELLWQNGSAFDTAAMRTHFSGLGWAIFVLSPRGVFYTGSHVVGQFHHSSFLQGRPVKGAGEWKVEKGKLKLITAKSGHYQPQKCHFIACLESLRPMLQMYGTRVTVFPETGSSSEKSKSVTIEAEKFLRESENYSIWKPRE